jgi:hypothetical protein
MLTGKELDDVGIGMEPASQGGTASKPLAPGVAIDEASKRVRGLAPRAMARSPSS